MHKKICTKCKIEKPLEDFNKNSQSPDGINTRCKLCTSEYMRKYKQKNRKKINEQARILYKKNIEKEKQRSVNKYHNNKKKESDRKKEYYKKNKTKIDNRNKQWVNENKENFLKYQKEHYQKNKKIINTKRIQLLKNNPELRSIQNMRTRLCKIHKIKNTKKALTTLNLIGCKIEKFKAYIESKFKPGMSWDNYGEWEIDHIKPCASFDLTDAEQQKACFHYSNLQPLWAKENRSKGARIA